MSNTVLAMGSQYTDCRAMRFARNQREAGIENLEWEGRMRPLRPLMPDVALASGLVFAFVTAVSFFG